MTIYYATDVHLTNNQPINRISPIGLSCVNTLNELLSVAKDGCLLLGGDLFESPCPSYELFNSVVKALKSAHCEVFSIFGNHDILYGDFVAENNAMRSLINMGLIKELGFKKTIIDGYDVYGVSYRKEIYKDFSSIGLNIENPEKSIVLTHQYMSDMKLPYNHIRLTEFSTNVPLVLCGHLHKPFSEVVNGTKYINTGCVCKLNRNEANFNTTIAQIVDNFDVNLIQLSSETNVQFVGKEVAKQDFVKSIEDAKIEKQDILSFIEKSDSPKHIKDLAIDLIKEYQNV